jgi:glycosyltransferase involved in cell wall biosynthesis
MNRIYHFIGKFENGGVESQFINSIANVYQKGYSYVVLCEVKKESIYDELTRKKGIDFIIIDGKTRVKKIVSFIRALRSNKVKKMHIHISFYSTILYAIIGRISGVKKVIVHAHTTNFKKSFLNRVLKKVIVLSARFLRVKFIADSKESGLLFFKRNFSVIPIVIDSSKYGFNSLDRKKERFMLGVSNEILLCNVGRLAAHKNHIFILDLLKILNYEDSNYKAVFVGDGEKYNDLINYAKLIGVYDSVIFQKSRKDIENILSASDIFVFPSTYEGLGLVAIEAQINGLTVLASDKIPEETRVTNKIKFISLKDKDAWIHEIQNAALISDQERASLADFFSESLSTKRLNNFLNEVYN